MYRVRAFDKDGFVLVQKRIESKERADSAFNDLMDSMEDNMKSDSFPYQIVFVSEDVFSEADWEIMSRDMITKG